MKVFLNPHLPVVSVVKLDSECTPNSESGGQVYFLIIRSCSDFKLKFIIRRLLSVQGTWDGVGVWQTRQRLSHGDSASSAWRPTPVVGRPCPFRHTSQRLSDTH